MLAGCAALDGLVQDGLLVDGLVEQLILHILHAQTIKGVSKALAGDALVTEEQDGALHHIQNLFLAGEYLAQGVTMGNSGRSCYTRWDR